MWAALTALALFISGWIALSVLERVGAVLSYLQPLLVPVAVAAIMAIPAAAGASTIGTRQWSDHHHKHHHHHHPHYSE